MDFVKFMFWTVMYCIMVVGYVIAAAVTGNETYAVMALLWLVILRQENTNGR